MEYTYNQEFLITSADVNFKQELRISSLSNFLIQIATSHANILGWGFEDMIKHKLSWVLYGMQIELDSYPKWEETIRIETWPKGSDRFVYLRDYLIYNSSDEIIGRVSSSWLLIDIERRRPRIHDPENKVFKQNLDRHAISKLMPTIKYLGETELEKKFEVNYSDVDINQHLTTTRYIDWLFDTFSISDLMNRRPKSLIVNFTKEIVFGQKAVMQRSFNDSGAYHFQLIDPDTGKIFFQAELKF